MSRHSVRNLLALVALVALECLSRRAGAERPDVLMADFGISAGVVAIVGLISNIFGRFGGNKTDIGTKRALEGMRLDLTKMGKELTEMIMGVGWHLGAFFGVVKRLLEKIFGKLYSMLANLVGRIARILDRIFGPIIRFLDKVRHHLKQFYDKVLRPILDTIELVRGPLRLLSLFGVDWAKKLDAKLADIEHYVMAPYEWLVEKVNEARDWINRIVTVDGLLQRLTLLQSVYRDHTGILNLAWNASHIPLTGDRLARYQTGIDTKPVTEAVSEARAYVVDRGGPDRPRIDEAVNDVRLRLARLGVI